MATKREFHLGQPAGNCKFGVKMWAKIRSFACESCRILGHQIWFPLKNWYAWKPLTTGHIYGFHGSYGLRAGENWRRPLASSPFYHGQLLDQGCDFLQCHHQCMWERTSLGWRHALWRHQWCLVGETLFTGKTTTIISIVPANFCWFLYSCKVKHTAMDAARKRPLPHQLALKTMDPLKLDGPGTSKN